MRSIFLTCLCLCVVSAVSAQDSQVAIGYKLKRHSEMVRIYQDANGHPDLSIYNVWIYDYWFKIDKTESIDGVTYILMTIPATMKWNKRTQKYEPNHFTAPVKWDQEGAPVDSDDYNSWLWMTKTDFDKLSMPYYGRFNRQWVFSGLTVPFKYRPSINAQTSSLLTGDVNLGTFIGVRFASSDNTGFSVGGSFGLASLIQNASNNTAINDKSSQTISGFNYGFAAVVDWQKKFQVGVVFGFDHRFGDLSKTYSYQDKSWIAVSLNYQFLDFGKNNGPVQSANNKGAKK